MQHAVGYVGKHAVDWELYHPIRGISHCVQEVEEYCVSVVHADGSFDNKTGDFIKIVTQDIRELALLQLVAFKIPCRL